MQIVEHNACCKDGGEGEDGGGDTQDEARTLGCSGSQGPAVEEERALSKKNPFGKKQLA